MEVDFCQSAWVRLFNHGLNDKCAMKSEMRLTGKIQPRLTVWHSSYSIRQGKKTHYNMVQFGIWILSGLCYSAFENAFFQNFLGGWQLATNGYSSHGHFQYNLSSTLFLVFPPKYWYCGPYVTFCIGCMFHQYFLKPEKFAQSKQYDTYYLNW